MTPEEKCIIAFNRFLADFVRDINKASPELKQKNRENYSSISMCKRDYVDAMLSRIGTIEDVDSLEILDSTTVGEICTATGDRKVVMTYTYLLLAVARLLERITAEDDGKVTAFLDIVAKIQDNEGAISLEDIETAFSCSEDSGVVEMLKSMLTSSQEVDEEAPKKDMFGMNPDILDDTLIGSIAKEVVAELDVEKLAGAASGISSIDDVMKAISGGGKNGGDTSNLISSIVNKVGSKLQDKMSTGGLNQQDLIKEAFSMFGPLMGDMMKHMPMDNNKRNATTKERLQKKVMEKAGRS